LEAVTGVQTCALPIWEFPRIVGSPGSVEEAFRLAAEMLSLVWRCQAVGILLSDKHLLESSVTVDLDPLMAAWAEPLAHSGRGYRRYAETPDGISPLLFPPSREVIKWNSYEHDEAGITTEDGHSIARMHDKRLRKTEAVRRAVEGLTTVNRYGDKGPVIFTYGSTTMSVLEALRAGGIEARVVQPIYLEPFPVWALGEHRGSSPVVVEQSAGGQFARLLAEKAGIGARAVIRRYDGRPFDPDELAAELRSAFK
jgi:2-oxoglutarate ferredoxin oxidoreductase subunit alpha